MIILAADDFRPFVRIRVQRNAFVLKLELNKKAQLTQGLRATAVHVRRPFMVEN